MSILAGAWAVQLGFYVIDRKSHAQVPPGWRELRVDRAQAQELVDAEIAIACVREVYGRDIIERRLVAICRAICGCEPRDVYAVLIAERVANEKAAAAVVAAKHAASEVVFAEFRNRVVEWKLREIPAESASFVVVAASGSFRASVRQTRAQLYLLWRLSDSSR